jgi:hypothetical protein
MKAKLVNEFNNAHELYKAIQDLDNGSYDFTRPKDGDKILLIEDVYSVISDTLITQKGLEKNIKYKKGTKFEYYDDSWFEGNKTLGIYGEWVAENSNVFEKIK